MPTARTLRSPISVAAAALLLLLGITLIAVGRAQASAGTGISTTTTTVASVGATNTMNLSVSLATADTLSGFDITLTYDPAVAVPTNVAVDSRWNLPVVDCAPITDCNSGTLQLAYVQLPADNPCLGGATCVIATITWQGVAAGSADLEIAPFQLSGTENGQLANNGLTGVETNAGTLSVLGPPQSTSTSTNTATSTSTNTPTATNTPTNTPLPRSTTSGSTSNTPTNTPTATNTAVPPAAGSSPTNSPTATNTPSATQPASSTQPASNTVVAPTATGTPAASDPGATATPTEEVAGQITPGAHVTPIPPDAGTGFSFDGGRDGLTLVGLLMVLVSLTVLVPSGLAAARETHRHSAERAMKRYLDAMENSGREEMTRR